MRPDHDPSTGTNIALRAEAVLADIQRRHGHFQQMNLERWHDHWRLRYRRRDPETGEVTRHAVSLRGTPVESTAMARYLEDRLEKAKQSCRSEQTTKVALEVERHRCQSLIRKLRARVVAACRQGRRQQDEMGRAFDSAAALGPERLEEFLRLRLWTQPSHQQRQAAFEAEFFQRYPFLAYSGRATI